MKQCIAATGSVTYAMKLTELLGALGIRARVTKLDPGVTRRGCAYGVMFPCSETQKVRTTATQNGVKITEII